MNKNSEPNPPTALALSKSSIYLNRELSQLAFNRRVLCQAEDSTVPLLERLRYLCIVSNNLDEFFEVRIASLLAQGRIDGETRETPALVAALERTSIECHQVVERQYTILNDEILPQLSNQGIHLLRDQDRSDMQRAWVKAYFDREVRPLLTPIGLDPAHPFPQVVNKSLNFIVELSGKDAFGRGTAIAIVKAPRVLPRVIQLPTDPGKQGLSFCLLSSVIHAHIADMFTGTRSVVVFAVSRDAQQRLVGRRRRSQESPASVAGRIAKPSVRRRRAPRSRQELPAAIVEFPVGTVFDQQESPVCGRWSGRTWCACPN